MSKILRRKFTGRAKYVITKILTCISTLKSGTVTYEDKDPNVELYEKNT